MKSETNEAVSQKECRFCDSNFKIFKYKLKETKGFLVVCTEFPLCEGHILIIPKNHFACVGEFDDKTMEEFTALYREVGNFIKNQYGSVSAFEHGKIGQTVFHSHVHVLPYGGDLGSIIPEGMSFASPLGDIEALRKIYVSKGKYLFLSIGDRKWTIDTKLGVPGFFLNRFADAMGKPNRADWRTMAQNEEIMKEASKEIENFRRLWAAAHSG